MITCWLYQRVVSTRLDEWPSSTGWAKSHVEYCLNCREIHRVGMAVPQRLSAGAAAERQPSPPFLHARIMRAIRAETHLDFRARPARRNSPVSVAVGAASLVLLAAVIWIYRPRTPAEHASVPTQPLADLDFKLELPGVAQMNEWSSALDAPLENETQLVLNDAKSALSSLKNSFLPETGKGDQTRRN